MIEAQGDGLIREQSPPNTTPAQARESALLQVDTQLQSDPFTRELHRFNV